VEEGLQLSWTVQPQIKYGQAKAR